MMPQTVSVNARGKKKKGKVPASDEFKPVLVVIKEGIENE